jgi:hypothetical protein
MTADKSGWPGHNRARLGQSAKAAKTSSYDARIDKKLQMIPCAVGKLSVGSSNAVYSS